MKAKQHNCYSIYILVLLCALILSSCNHSIQDLVNQYNNSIAGTVHTQPSPNSPDFDPALMLKEDYIVSKEAMFCLTAPDSDYYLWQLYRINRHEVEYNGGTFITYSYDEVSVEGMIPITEKNLVIYVPNAEDVLTPGTYILKLTVKDNNGNKYSDKARLVIYDPCYSMDISHIGDFDIPEDLEGGDNSA